MDLFGSTDPFSSADFNMLDYPSPDGALALSGATSATTDDSSGTSFISSAWNAITGLVTPSNDSSSGGTNSTGSPLTSAVTGLLGIYNKVGGLFGAKPVSNPLANANTTANRPGANANTTANRPGANANTTANRPGAPAKSHTLLYIGIGVLAVVGIALLMKKR